MSYLHDVQPLHTVKVKPNVLTLGLPRVCSARGSEISFLLYGSIEFGMVEENVLRNELIMRNLTQAETIHIPQGERKT